MKHTPFTLALLGIVACTVDPTPTDLEPGSSGDASFGSTGEALDTGGSTGGGNPTEETTATGTSSGADESGSTGGSTGPAEPVCGDGQVTGDEVCDDGINDGSYGGCNAGCGALGPHCGDAQVQGPEACDDGDQTNGNGCNVDCIASGSLIWSRQLAGNVYYDIALDDQGGVLAVANTNAKAQYYDNDGTPGWSADIAEDRARAVAWHPTEGWVVAGTSAGQGGDDVWFRRYDAVGAEQASFDYASSYDDDVNGVAFDSLGNIYAAGVGGVNSDRVAWLRKFTSAGAELWNLSVDGAGSQLDYGADVAVAPGDQVIFAGHSGVSGQGTDLWVRGYDTEKNEQWVNGYASADDDQAGGIGLDPVGGFVIAGSVESNQAIWAGRFNDTGFVAGLAETPPEGTYELGLDAAVDSTGAVVAVGISTHGAPRAGIRKWDASGALMWSFDAAPDGGTAALLAVTIDTDDTIFVAGGWQEAGILMDGWVAKYAP